VIQAGRNEIEKKTKIAKADKEKASSEELAFPEFGAQERTRTSTPCGTST